MIQIIDARAPDIQGVNGTSDVCIVGAGAAGLFLASRLVSRGMRVIVVEAGGRICTQGQAIGIDATFEGGSYGGATEGRAFGLGGSTSVWGGQLVPYLPFDFRGLGACAFDPWRHIVAMVERHAAAVAEALELRPPPDWTHASRLLPKTVANILHRRGLETVVADWLRFRKRNFAFLLATLPKRATGELIVFLNAHAALWGIQPVSEGRRRVTSLTARTGRQAITIKAKSFVLAAGAIETTRILLEMERQSPTGICRQGAAVGRYLTDHLSCCIADVAPKDFELCSHFFGPRFRAGRMNTFHFVERHAPPDAPRGFFHFIFDHENDGFYLAKKILASLQARTVPQISFKEVVGGTSGLVALAWNRWMRRRLYLSEKTPAHLQLDIEQSPRSSNCIKLGEDVDAVGRPNVIVRWQVHEEDHRAICALASRFLMLWPEGERGFPDLLPVLDNSVGPKPHDVYHPVGTCRMGVDSEAVVDPELRVHGTDNLWVLSTAVFPSAGTANPTFSMLCLGEALVETLARESLS